MLMGFLAVYYIVLPRQCAVSHSSRRSSSEPDGPLPVSFKLDIGPPHLRNVETR